MKIPLKIAFREGLSAAVKDLIKQILKIEPNERPEIDTIMQHPWLAGERLKEENSGSAGPDEPEFDLGDSRIQSINSL